MKSHRVIRVQNERNEMKCADVVVSGFSHSDSELSIGARLHTIRSWFCFTLTAEPNTQTSVGIRV